MVGGPGAEPRVGHVVEAPRVEALDGAPGPRGRRRPLDVVVAPVPGVGEAEAAPIDVTLAVVVGVVGVGAHRREAVGRVIRHRDVVGRGGLGRAHPGGADVPGRGGGEAEVAAGAKRGGARGVHERHLKHVLVLVAVPDVEPGDGVAVPGAGGQGLAAARGRGRAVARAPVAVGEDVEVAVAEGADAVVAQAEVARRRRRPGEARAGEEAEEHQGARHGGLGEGRGLNCSLTRRP